MGTMGLPLGNLDVRESQYIALSLASGAQVNQLESFYHSQQPSLLPCMLDILLYLPETLPPSCYIPLVKRIVKDRSSSASTSESEIGPVVEIVLDVLSGMDMSNNTIQRYMASISLQEINTTEFLETRVRQIDRFTGTSDYGIQLLRDFPQECCEWRRGIIAPWSILHHCGDTHISIDKLENLTTETATNLLLRQDLADELEQIFGDVLVPWATYKQVVGDFCSHIKHMIAEPTKVSLRSVLRIFSVVSQSELEFEKKEEIASGAMLACYRTTLRSDESDHYAELQTIAAILANTFKAVHTSIQIPSFDALPETNFTEFEKTLMQNNSARICIAQPSNESIATLQTLIEASFTVGSMREAISLRLSGFEHQLSELKRLLEVVRTDPESAQFRQALLSQNLFGKIPKDTIEYMYLESLLLNKKIDLAKRTYIATSPRPLKSARVEEAILQVFSQMFERAKSISRRDMSPINNILSIVHPRHTNEKIRRAQLLVDTVIELSAYGGSSYFTPQQVRDFSVDQATDFFSRILQSRGNYPKHFRLLGLYQNLSLALQLETDETQFNELVVNAALSFDDLKFCIDFIDSIEISRHEDVTPTVPDSASDPKDTTWRLIYSVCKYPAESSEVIRKQLDLLSRAISICPPTNIHELILLYNRLEKSAISLEEETDAWGLEDDEMELDPDEVSSDKPTLRHQSSTTSQAQARNTKIEMPQWRLFEAAQAATRTAREYLPKTENDGETAEGRVRKRDQIAGLVGSGVGAVESKFTSGLGWIRTKPFLSNGYLLMSLVGADQ